MTKQDCDQILHLLDKLLTEAPCHNQACVGHMNCNYGVNGCYGEECAIDVIMTEVSQYMYRNKMF